VRAHASALRAGDENKKGKKLTKGSGRSASRYWPDGLADATIPERQSMTTVKHTAGEYESAENILHLWFPHRVELTDEEAIRAFFDEVLVDWIQPCPSKPFLLVNFSNLHIRASMAKVYAKNIARFQSLLLGTYRYGVPPTFTGVTVALGNLQLGAPANMFDDERSAREAIRQEKAKQGVRVHASNVRHHPPGRRR
jgi:hypothetical protein